MHKHRNPSNYGSPPLKRRSVDALPVHDRRTLNGRRGRQTLGSHSDRDLSGPLFLTNQRRADLRISHRNAAVVRPRPVSLLSARTEWCPWDFPVPTGRVSARTFKRLICTHYRGATRTQAPPPPTCGITRLARDGETSHGTSDVPFSKVVRQKSARQLDVFARRDAHGGHVTRFYVSRISKRVLTYLFFINYSVL